MSRTRNPAARRKSTAHTDVPTLSEEDGVRYLHFNSEWIQGAMRVARPSDLVLAYTQQMMAWLLFLRPGMRDRVGILGLGAGSLLRFTLRHTRAQVDTVERNPGVTAMCQAFFRLPGSVRSTIDHADARDWVAEPGRAGAYRALMVDLYDSQAQGPVCDEPSFYRDCYRILDEPGIMTVNLFGQHDSFEHNLQGIRAAFDGRVLCLPEIDQGNTVVLAFKGSALDLSAGDLLDTAATLESRTGLPAQRWARSLLAGVSASN
ncbi:spermidine synthase [Castellaniella sp. MT123]|uniref:spermidine synthase n=1 Tax=Castellaniella sp. MT123 TaxID=3140381 RepID=UPI0031F3571E|nr:spermidine synthase [Castellaniella sp.]